jgi:hypothetical protein
MEAARLELLLADYHDRWRGSAAKPVCAEDPS